MKLGKASLKWALAHIERFGDIDIFPVPFEYAAIRANWGRLLPQLLATELDRYPARELRRTLTPKSRYGFRLATQLDPIDALLFTATVCELAHDLERYRVPASRNIVMSHRVHRTVDGQLYSPRFTFETFKQRLLEKCQARPKSWVVVTDIADFYSRVYHHPLENALRAATQKHAHVDVLMHFLSQWNYSVSYGIPIGPAASRILAEVAISDVDHALIDEDVDFCRFSDDFRLFAQSERDAFRILAVLASYLQENHGLTLSERKTDIISADRFVARFLEGTRPGDSARLADQVGQILDKYGRQEDAYAALDVEELPEALVQELDALDLNSVLQEQIGDQRMYDSFAVSIALRRLAQLRDETLLDLVVESIDQLTSVLPQVVNFIQKVTPSVRRPEVGAQILEAIDAGASGHQEYQRVWLLSLFASDPTWDNRDALVRLMGDVRDDLSRPLLLQSLGVAAQPHWFRRSRREIQSMGGWERRSFIRGAMCMGHDEYGHWMRSLLPRLDELDQLVGRYCLDNLRATP